MVRTKKRKSHSLHNPPPTPPAPRTVTDEKQRAEQIKIALSSPVDKRLVLELANIVLAFEAFPYKRHTGLNIAKWIKSSLARVGLELGDVVMMVPDGAANGIKAVKYLDMKYDICPAHQLHRSILYACGFAGKPSQNAKLALMLRNSNRIASKASGQARAPLAPPTCRPPPPLRPRAAAATHRRLR